MKEEYNNPNQSKRSSSSFKISNYLPNANILPIFIVTFGIGYICASYSNRTIVLPTDHNRFDLPQCGTEKVPPEQVRNKVLYTLFDGISPYQNFPPEGIADLIQGKRLDGWGSNDEVFKNLIEKVSPKIIIEIGTFMGASATHMATIARELGLKSQILCLDDFRGWAGFRNDFKTLPMQNGNVMLLAQFMQNVITLNLTENILPLPFSSSSSLDLLCQLGVKGDLIEIDAAHDFHSAWDDINRAFRLLNPSGTIFGHDYFNSVDDYGVKRAVDLFAKIHGLQIITTREHWVIEMSG